MVSALAVLLIVPVAWADAPSATDFARYCPDGFEPLDRNDLDPIRPIRKSWAQDWLQIDRLGRMASGKGVKVAVLDTGLQVERDPTGTATYQNEQFDNADIDRVHGKDFTAHARAGPDGAYVDCDKPREVAKGFHGTKVASLIVAQPNRGTEMTGIAPRAQLLPIRVLVEAERNSTGQQALAAGIRYAVDRGAQVINASIVSRSDNPALRAAVEYAEEKNVLIVAAAGNRRTHDPKVEPPGPGYPAMYAKDHPNVISVGAHDEAGHLMPVSEFNAVTVAAPGRQVVTSFPLQGNTADDGTSFAAPLVTGTAALLIDQAQRSGRTLTPAQIRRRIELTAADAPAGKPDRGYGYGLLDPMAALTQPIDNPNATVPPEQAAGVEPLPPPAPLDNTPRDIAIAAIGIAIAIAATILAIRATLRAGPSARPRARREGRYGRWRRFPGRGS